MTTLAQTELGTTVQLKTDFKSALARVAETLKAEGYGVLTEIDVQETLKKKLGVDFRPYKILGACNPSLAYRALTASHEVGLFLPCNVTVSQREEGIIEIALVDPLTMLQVVSNPQLRPIAEEAKARLDRVAAALQK